MIARSMLMTVILVLLGAQSAAHNITGPPHHGQSGLAGYTGEDPTLAAAIIVLALLMVLLAAIRAVQLYFRGRDD
jgi:hypothetical protein